MAEGGGDREEQNEVWWDNDEDYCDQPDTASRQTVGDQSRILCNHFITERLRREQNSENRLDEQDLFAPGTPRDESLVGPEVRQIGNALQEIGDQLDGDSRLQQLIDQVPTDCPSESFMNVAREIFRDGNFNWGRVVTLFYFAYKFARKAIKDVSIIRKVIEWVVDFIKRYVAQWILSRGGWSAIQEYFGSTTGQALGVFLAGILSAYFVYKKYQ